VIIYLIRHGHTALNAAGVLRGRLDPDLDSTGRAEAEALARSFARVPLELVVSSPLRRALATAEALARPHGLDVNADDGWLDRDYGPWAGQPVSKVKERFGSLDDAPGVEPRTDFEARVLGAFGRLVDALNPAATAAVVAHDALNRLVISKQVHGSHHGTGTIAQATGCWNRLEHGPEGWTAPVVGAPPARPAT
jgi:broad specificity phosphatase PhoE